MDRKNSSSFLDTTPPRKDFWLLFKVASYERLVQMQKGLLYMNSIEYFSSLKDKEPIALRVDKSEKVYGVLKADSNSIGYSTLSLKLENNEELDLGSEAILTAHFPKPQNTMLFCMGALAEGQDGVIQGEVDDKIYFNKKFLEFGSHLLLISNPKEFSDRVNRAIDNEPETFGSKLFHDGYGLVDYKPLENHSGPIGLYVKDSKYSWQMEFRISFGVNDNCLNQNGAYELNIGDITDISQIIPVQVLIDEPFNIKRRTFRKIGEDYEQISD